MSQLLNRADLDFKVSGGQDSGKNKCAKPYGKLGEDHIFVEGMVLG
jgi:hypothetical protein